MQTAFRKIGNSQGIILPKPILRALGVETGAAMELVVEEGRVIATPVRSMVREGWEVDAKRIGAESLADSDEWLWFGNEGDDELGW